MAAGHGHTQVARFLLERLASATFSSSSSENHNLPPRLLPAFSTADGVEEGSGSSGGGSREAMGRARGVVNGWNAQTGETALWLAVHEVGFGVDRSVRGWGWGWGLGLREGEERMGNV